ncbi:MAG: hypothetical protein ACJ8C4_16900 [Gemmataceae bacterium]
MNDPSDLHLILLIPLLPALFFLWGWVEWTRGQAPSNRQDLDSLLHEKYTGGFARFARRVREHRRSRCVSTDHPATRDSLEKLIATKNKIHSELMPHHD